MRPDGCEACHPVWVNARAKGHEGLCRLAFPAPSGFMAGHNSPQPAARGSMADEAAGDGKRAILARHAFFRDLPAAALDRLAQRTRIATCAAGARVFSKGDGSQELVAVLEGVVKISTGSAEGREVVFRLVGSDEVFGELSLADNKPRAADATAMTACRLCLVDCRDLIPAIMEEPLIGMKLLALVAGRLRDTTRQALTTARRAHG